MNNEIKEKIKAYYIGNDIDEVLDYTTNLQQEIEKLNDDKRGMLVQLYKANDEKDKIKQENERLKENNQAMQEEMARVWAENERLKLELSGYREAILRNDELLGLQDYKSRCEKAIEYIDEMCKFGDKYACYGDDLHPEYIVNILQNGSDS